MDTPALPTRPARRGVPLWAVFAAIVVSQAVILGAFALFIYPNV